MAFFARHAEEEEELMRSRVLAAGRGGRHVLRRGLPRGGPRCHL